MAGVLVAACSRLRAFGTRAMAGLNATWRRLTRPVPLVAGVAGDLVRSRGELIAENALLRQQLIVASRKIKTPVFQPRDQDLLVLLARLVPGWRDALLLVKPETVLRWHRAGFRVFWRSKSKVDARREPKAAAGIIRYDGHGDLHPRGRLRDDHGRDSREQRCLLGGHHRGQEISPWPAPDDTAVARLIRDRDRVYGAKFDTRVNNLGIRQLRIAPKAPWQNGHAERFVGTLRGELLDHVMVLGERHLLHLVRQHANHYYNEDHPHMSLDRDAPASRAVEPPDHGKVVALPRVGGLHHRYIRRAA